MYQEQIASNSFDAVLQAAQVGAGTRLLDVACGSGMALQRAAARGAECTGVDASAELLAIARDRVPSAELLHCDMSAMPLPDASFDVVTSFNGIQFGARDAVHECARVLRRGGLFALVFWEDPGDFGRYFAAVGSVAPAPAPGAPSPMALREPGVAEALVQEAGLTVLSRGSTEVVGLYRDTDDAYRGLASSGPAWSAIEHAGEDALHTALAPVIDSFSDPVTGRVRVAGTFGHVIASSGD